MVESQAGFSGEIADSAVQSHAHPPKARPAPAPVHAVTRRTLIARSDEEIIAKCRELWPDAEPYNEDGKTPAIQVMRDGPVVKIAVGGMCHQFRPQLRFKEMLALSRFFDTMLIEELGEFEARDGCATCEYGGAHGFVVRIEPGAPYDPEVGVAAERVT